MLYIYYNLVPYIGGLHVARWINIGILGDYQAERHSHKATMASLNHCANYLGFELSISWLPTASLEVMTDDLLRQFDGLWCAPGEYCSMDGALNAIQYAREHNIPFIGTCQGFQHMVIEYSRNKLGLKDAQHIELHPDAPNLVITGLSCSFIGETRKVIINKDSKMFSYYNKEETMECFTCNFGINPKYKNTIDESGFKIVGTDETGEARILELSQNDFFVATLFQPQLKSTPDHPHQLIRALLTHAAQFHKRVRL